MSLGFTQLKAAASKKSSCSERLPESFLKNQLTVRLLTLFLLVVDSIEVKAHYRVQ